MSEAKSAANDLPPHIEETLGRSRGSTPTTIARSRGR
jgi:hypothetical protein